MSDAIAPAKNSKTIDPAKSLVLQKVNPKDVQTLTSVTIPTPAENSSLDDILKEIEQLSLDALKALIRSIITILITKIL